MSQTIQQHSAAQREEDAQIWRNIFIMVGAFAVIMAGIAYGITLFV